MLSFYVLIPSLSVKSSGTVVSLCLHLLSYFSFSFGLCLSQFASFCFCLFRSLVSISNCPCLSPRRILFHPLLFVSKCLDCLCLSLSLVSNGSYLTEPCCIQEEDEERLSSSNSAVSSGSAKLPGYSM
jgi:hypothetical protein